MRDRPEPAGAMSERRGILAIGNLLVDKMHRIPHYPAESFLAVIDESLASPGGGAFNVLCDLACVDPGLPLAVAGLVGDDEDGRLVRSEFEKHGIDATRIGIVTGRPTSFTHVMISEAHATRTFFHSHGVNSRLGLDQIRAINGSERIAHLAYLLLLEGLDISDAEYGSGGAHALALLRKKGFQTSLDLVSDNDPERYRRFVEPALPHTDYLIVNDIEAANLAGSPPITQGGTADWGAAFDQAQAILDMGVHRLVAIHFPDGAVAVTGSGERCQQPSYPVPKAELVSALGAGDAFCAGMLYGIHEGYALGACLKLGVALAHCNLFAASATEGARPLHRLKALIAEKDQAVLADSRGMDRTETETFKGI